MKISLFWKKKIEVYGQRIEKKCTTKVKINAQKIPEKLQAESRFMFQNCPVQESG